MLSICCNIIINYNNTVSSQEILDIKFLLIGIWFYYTIFYKH